MHFVTHLLTGWVVANGPRLERRDQAIITLAAVAPDFDGAGIVAELATRNTEDPLLWWSEYHHVLGHNLIFGVLVAGIALAVAKRRWMVGLLALFVFHLHLLQDLVGSRGPDGYDWPIPYLFPLVPDFELTWSGQWAFNAWPNFAFTCLLLAVTLWLAWQRGYSVVGLVSQRADRALVATLRRRFGVPEPVPDQNV